MVTHEGMVGHNQALDANEEVMRALLIHEKKSMVPSVGGAVHRPITSQSNASDTESDTSESDEDFFSETAVAPSKRARDDEKKEEEEEEDFEEVGENTMVLVGGRSFSYREVSQRPELVEQMTAQEKDAYIEMGQQLFQDMYY